MSGLMVLVGCNPPSTEAVTPTGLKDTPAVANVNMVLPKSINDNLPILQIEVAELKKIGQQITFRFFVDNEQVMSIRGWTKPYNKKSEEVVMQIATPSGTRLGPGNYLGNLYLEKKDLLKIIDLAEARGHAYIRFVPYIDIRVGSVGQVTYRMETSPTLLRLWNSVPADSLFFLVDTTGLAAPPSDDELLNPSPPRNE